MERLHEGSVAQEMPEKTYLHDRILHRTVLKLFPKRIWPNHLTILRMLMTPVVFWFLWIGEYGTGIALFIIASFTDLLDGSLARTRGQVTHWGQVWDPVADKLLIGSVVALLLFRNFRAEFAVAVIGCEGAFLIGGFFRIQQGVIVSANWWGKLKMLCQVIGVTSYLLYLYVSSPWLQQASYAAFALAILLALGSLLSHGL
jgi:CDP-diacylglycerol--glycerol-3-phosphate 3-phosphatidyltransferase